MTLKLMPHESWQCSACGDRLQGPVLENLDHVAAHEAGHAVMHWLLLPETLGLTCIHPDGSGTCMSSRPEDLVWIEDKLLIVMAGPVAEAGMLKVPHFDFERARCHDFEEARHLLTPTILQQWLRGRFTQMEAMQYYYETAHKRLWPYVEALDFLAWRLTLQYVLTADEVREICQSGEG
jgi:hypothetical protein